MSRTYTFDLPYPPLSGNRAARKGQGKVYTPRAIQTYRSAVAVACSRAGVARLALRGPLEAVFVVAPPDNRARDADNLLKVVKDAITRAGVWADDSNRVIASESVQWTTCEKGGAVMVLLRDSVPAGWQYDLQDCSQCAAGAQDVCKSAQ